MKKILLLAFTIFAPYSPFYSFAQNANLAQADLPDKTPAKAAETTKQDAASINTKSVIIDKSALLDTGNNILGHTNDLVNMLLGNDNKVVSLMFGDEEINNVDRAIDSLKNEKTYAPEEDPNSAEAKKAKEKKAKEDAAIGENEKSYIYLASIIYYSPKEWALWINNLKITSDNNKNNKELFIKEIYPDRAKIIWSLSVSKWKILSGKKSEDEAPQLNAKNNVEIEFILKPNQTFILSSGRIVEGRAVVNKELAKGAAATKEIRSSKKAEVIKEKGLDAGKEAAQEKEISEEKVIIKEKVAQ